MKILSAVFLKSAVGPSHYPPESLPEIAFVGRSNVGKSSLINSLVQRKGLAKTSNSPGRTRLINFFTINDQFLLVDLPGYGFAKVPEEVKKGWGLMVEAYFRERKTLRLVVFLLDIRRMQVSDNDLAMVRWFEYYRIPYLLALTKIDKVSKQQVIKHRQNILDMMEKPAAADVLFSARTGAGREEMWAEIEKFIFNTGNNA